jgi:hypothetical protein
MAISASLPPASADRTAEPCGWGLTCAQAGGRRGQRPLGGRVITASSSARYVLDRAVT